MNVKGNDRILFIKQGSNFVPIACLTENSFSESSDTFSITTRLDGGWTKAVPDAQSYQIDFSGINQLTGVSYFDLQSLKRQQVLLTWGIGTASNVIETGLGHLIDISSSDPTNQNSVFSGTIRGYGMPETTALIGVTYEANDCLVNSLNSLTDREFKEAKLILAPNGYVVDKLPTIKPNGGSATVTRNTTKTRVNSSGLIESLPANVLAPDYLNGVCPALNVEGQATNLIGVNNLGNPLVQSEATSTLTTGVLNPFGVDADVYEISDSINNLRHIVNISEIPTDGNTYSRSCFIKNNNQRYVGISTGTGSNFDNFANIYDLQNEIFTVTNSLFDVEKYDNGWFRINCRRDSADPTNKFITIGFSDNGTNTVYSGGSNSFYAYQPQVELGKMSSLIVTTNEQVTRSADTVTIPIPTGTTEIIEKYEDGTTNTITTIPASPYTVPTGRYEYILMR